MFGRRHDAPARPAPQWTRRKMLALLAGAVVVALVLVAGLVLAVGYALRPHDEAAPGVGTSGSSEPHGDVIGGGGGGGRGSQLDARDALAARPMAQVDDAASHPGMLSSHDPGTAIELPGSTTVGAAAVPTGFPHTPVGAMAQLAAIDQTVMQSGSIATAREVVTAWALPGGPTPDTWSTLQALARLLSAAQSGATAQLAIVLSPLMGQVKGSVGPDFVIPCIDFELDVTLAQTARGAVADCQRMIWQPTGSGGRWLIGPGAEPAAAPAVWPGTDLSFAVGYRYLHQEPTSE